MTLEEIKKLEGITINEIDPTKRHVIVIGPSIPKSVAIKLGAAWQTIFGQTPIVVRDDTGDFHILEIKL
jgi:hypothetical protein